jgi:hypothetical protein
MAATAAIAITPQKGRWSRAAAPVGASWDIPES